MATVTEQVRTNFKTCDEVARLIRAFNVPPELEQSSLPNLPEMRIANFYFALVAICHQTSPRGMLPLEGVVDGIYRKGWEYLFARFEQVCSDDSTLLSPERWATVETEQIRGWFSDPINGDRLHRPEIRAALLRDLGRRMVELDWSTIEIAYRRCGGLLRNGRPNLLETLSQFDAYRDPVQKKSVFFLSLMRTTLKWSYPDSEFLRAPVDYHEVRGHLRLGTAIITDSDLYARVVNEQPVSEDEDIAIRMAVAIAIDHISETSGIRSPSRLHYLFWHVFRAVCRRDAPLCSGIPSSQLLPDRYQALVVDCRCPFASVCQSANVVNPILEHVFETDFY